MSTDNNDRLHDEEILGDKLYILTLKGELLNLEEWVYARNENEAIEILQERIKELREYPKEYLLNHLRLEEER